MKLLKRIYFYIYAWLFLTVAGVAIAQGATEFDPQSYFRDAATLGGVISGAIAVLRSIFPAIDGAPKIRTLSFVLGVIFALAGRLFGWMEGDYPSVIVFGLSAGYFGFSIVDLGRTVFKSPTPKLAEVKSFLPSNPLSRVVDGITAALGAFFPESRPYWDIVRPLVESLTGRVNSSREQDELMIMVTEDLRNFALAIKSAEDANAVKQIAQVMLAQLTIKINERFPIKGV